MEKRLPEKNLHKKPTPMITGKLYIWKYFVSNIRADSFRPPKLFCSPTAMVLAVEQESNRN